MGNLYDNRIWIDDIDKIISNFPNFKQLSNKSILITGASGLIGSSIVDIIHRFNDLYDANIKVYAAGRNFDKMKRRFGDAVYRKDFEFVLFDATKSDNKLEFFVDYIIHGASNAFPQLIMKEPVETMLCNFCGMKNLLDYAKERNVNRLLYISSSEIYGNSDAGNPFREQDYGFIDILNPRNSYSVSKRATETLCASYALEYGVDTVMIRPGHVYGPTASLQDNRVSSIFAYSAAKGDNIVMKSDGKQLRSYCYSLDAASAILTVLINGETLKAYNISSEDEVISIFEMAKMCSNIGNVELKIQLASNEEKQGFNPMLNSSLDGSEIRNLGWKSSFTPYEGFEHTIQILHDALAMNLA